VTPRLIACYDGALYARMARVLAASAAQHCPHWDRQIVARRLFDVKEVTVNARVRNSSVKLAEWVKAVDESPDGTPLLLIDADCLILRPLDDVWDRPFDVAYTKRDPARSKLPHNAGVLFVRATPATRAFLHAWLEDTKVIRTSTAKMQQARRQFGACDQAALATTLKRPVASAAAIVQLPCREWNCEDSEWGRFDPSLTRIVHIKGALREALIGNARLVSAGRMQTLPRLIERWREVEARA